MTVRFFFIGSLITAITAWTIWVLIIKYLDPVQAGPLGYFLFFLALFLALAATASLGGYFIRRLILPHQLSAYTVRLALRQGVLFAAFLDLLLLFQLIRLFRWWVAVIAICLFIFIEFIFLGDDRAARRSANNQS